MEEEIDLRPYIEALISKWYWIVGAAVLAGILAFVVSSMLPPSYEATALVTVTQPSEIVEFDNRIRSVDEKQPLNAYPEIALSDELMLDMLQEEAVQGSGIRSVEGMRGLLEASAGADPSLLHLTVTYGDPVQAAEIANLWADLFVKRVNEIYGNQGGGQLAFFQEQMDNAEAELTAAENALIEFQARNRSAILGNQLEALQTAQANQLTKQAQIESILQDTQGVLEQPVTDSQFITVLLQMRAFGGVQASEWPWQIQLNADQADAMSTAEQTAVLQELQAVLAAQLAAVETSLNELEPQILAVQQSKQEAVTENARLLRNQTLAEETYSALASKVEEERITSQDINSGVKLIGKTAVPETPTGSRLMPTLFAAVFAGMATIIIILAVTWWKSAEQVDTVNEETSNEAADKESAEIGFVQGEPTSPSP